MKSTPARLSISIIRVAVMLNRLSWIGYRHA